MSGVKLGYSSLDAYLMSYMSWEEIMIKILIQDTRKRFGSIENFLRKIGKEGIIDKLKEQLWRD